jgi:hypothetical protein
MIYVIDHCGCKYNDKLTINPNTNQYELHRIYDYLCETHKAELQGYIHISPELSKEELQKLVDEMIVDKWQTTNRHLSVIDEPPTEEKEINYNKYIVQNYPNSYLQDKTYEIKCKLCHYILFVNEALAIDKKTEMYESMIRHVKNAHKESILRRERHKNDI